MPLYEYECEACGKRFELIQKFSDPNPDACRVCGQGPVRRLMSSPAIQFKGTGWYITDYSKGNSGPAAAPSKTDAKSDAAVTGGSGDTAAAKDSSPADTKTESKPAPKADSSTSASTPAAKS